MKISLFSQSLFALPLREAIEVTASLGFSAIELACVRPHLDLETARDHPKGVVEQIQKSGLEVSALSLFNSFTDPTCLNDQIEAAETYIRLAPLFHTQILKMTPGPPGSAGAEESHWHYLGMALDRLVSVAEGVGVRLAFETHMRQLTDTLAGAKRFLAMVMSDVVGLTVDFLNLAFAGEKMPDVISSLEGRIYNTHVKNGTIGEDGSWRFYALDTGLVDYGEVLILLHDIRYSDYLTIECLGPEAQTRPVETAKRDLAILRRYLKQVEDFNLMPCQG